MNNVQIEALKVVVISYIYSVRNSVRNSVRPPPNNSISAKAYDKGLEKLSEIVYNTDSEFKATVDNFVSEIVNIFEENTK